MASLVADYGTSSGSESDSEESTTNTHKQPPHAARVGVNLLEAAADGRDDSDSDDDAPRGQASSSTRTPASTPAGLLPNPLAAPKLPSPALGAARPPETSVFVTSFHRAAEAKSSILEQHVKMTDTDLPAEMGGKKICWNFRKGKCRFGHKCKYSHGAEILGVGRVANGEEEAAEGAPSQPPQQHAPHGYQGHQSNHSNRGFPPPHGNHGNRGFPPPHGNHGNRGFPQQGGNHGNRGFPPHGNQGNMGYPPHGNQGYAPHGNQGYHQPWPGQPGESEAPVDEDDYLTNAKNKKKRVGVSDTLVPPKRAMRELDRFRQEERPWTLPQ